jgi:transcriptional regulator with XRE-family HTH domain
MPLVLDMAVLTPIARFLANRREELGLTLEQVGALVGKSKQSVWQREQGEARVKLREAEAWSKALRVPKETIARLIKSDSGNQIPVINRTAAGRVVDTLEWGTTSVEGFMYVDRDVQTDEDNLFAVVVDGSSMAPTLENKDIAVVKSVPMDADSMPAPGTVAYVRLGPDSKTPGGMLCRWHPQRDGTYRLDKDNPAFASVVVPREHVEQFGIVIQRRTTVR